MWDIFINSHSFFYYFFFFMKIIQEFKRKNDKKLAKCFANTARTICTFDIWFFLAVNPVECICTRLNVMESYNHSQNFHIQYYTYVRIFEKLCKLRNIYIYKNIFVRVLDRKNLHEQSLQKYRKKKKSLKSHYEKMQTKNNNRQSITLIYHKIIFVENLLHKFLSCIIIISLDLNWK